MEHEENELQPILSHVEPVLAVTDITATILYWQNVIGFTAKWTWGQPPNHGGVSWQKIFIQFSLNPALATVSKGNSIWIKVQHIETLYKLHQQKKAEIVYPLENQPWGLAQYTIREINGYYLHFGGVPAAREKRMAKLPSTVRIVERTPTAEEYMDLRHSTGNLSVVSDAMLEKRLTAAIFAVVAEDSTTGETIGCVLLLGDHASYYYVKDVMVRSDWQATRVGTAMMQALTDWLEKNGANNALVSLICAESLEPFYQQFGFSPAFGMIRYLHDDEKEM